MRRFCRELRLDATDLVAVLLKLVSVRDKGLVVDGLLENPEQRVDHLLVLGHDVLGDDHRGNWARRRVVFSY